MWRNDTKCKYMFMFPLKNLACKGLMILSLDGFCVVNQNKLLYKHLSCWWLKTPWRSYDAIVMDKKMFVPFLRLGFGTSRKCFVPSVNKIGKKSHILTGQKCYISHRLSWWKENIHELTGMIKTLKVPTTATETRRARRMIIRIKKFQGICKLQSGHFIG